MILIIIPSCHLVLCCEKPQWHQEYMYFPQFCRNVGNQKIPNLVNWYCFANCHQNLRTTEGRTSRSLFLWPCFRRNNTITIHRALKIRKKVEFSKLKLFFSKTKIKIYWHFFPISSSLCAMYYYHFSHKSSKAIRDLGKKILVVTVVKLYFAEVVTVSIICSIIWSSWKLRITFINNVVG